MISIRPNRSARSQSAARIAHGSALPLLEGADPKPLTFEVQPHRRPTTDRDQPLGAVDLAMTLRAGSVGGDVCRGVRGGIRCDPFFLPPKTPLQTRNTRNKQCFQGVGWVLNPEQKGLVPGSILAKSPLFSTLFRVFRVQRPDSGPQKNRTHFRPRPGAGDSA